MLATLAAAVSALAVLLLFLSAAAATLVQPAMPARAGDWYIAANLTGANVHISNTFYERLYVPFGDFLGRIVAARSTSSSLPTAGLHWYPYVAAVPSVL